MSRRLSLSELLYPTSPEDVQLAQAWASEVTIQVLNWVWSAFDDVLIKLNTVDWSHLDDLPEQLERDIAHEHFCEINSTWANETRGLSAIIPSHEIPEMFRRSGASAKPPAIDLGFVHRESRSWKWPVEAKILKTPQALAEYLSDVRKFESGVAGPFVGEGGMIGYLCSGSEDDTLRNLQENLNQTLQLVPEFAHRHHRTSQHSRSTAPDLRLHHMIMKCKN